jgi:hypothetical protein
MLAKSFVGQSFASPLWFVLEIERLICCVLAGAPFKQALAYYRTDRLS